MALFKRNQGTEQAEMSFIDHLEELRKHIIRSILAILIFAIVIFIYIDWVFETIIKGPINPDFVSYKALCDFSHWAHMGDALCMPPVTVNLQSTTFGGQFMGSISIAIVGGIIAAFPYIFWEFWRFVKPALKEKELKTQDLSFFGYLFSSSWVRHLVISCWAHLPLIFWLVFQLGNKGTIITIPTFSDYLDNLINIILGCGIAFELPVLAYLLTKIGLITPSYLRRIRKYAVVIILIAAAVITPSPDWMSQLLVFLPLFLLYELSILISARVSKEQERRDQEEWS